MFVTLLLTNPAAPALDLSLVQALADAWGGSAPRWLSPGEAAEFDMATIPDNRWDIWAELQGQGVDLLVVPSTRRRKQMLLADMDSTMIGQECIDELADFAGVGARVKDITARAMNGELDFDGALTERVALLAGLPGVGCGPGVRRPDHHGVGRADTDCNDEGQWRPCGLGLGRVHRVHHQGGGRPGI